MTIVGITGSAGAGKDVVATHLVKNHGFAKLSIADPIKRLALNVFDFDVLQLWGPSSSRNTFDPRYKECNIRSSGVSFEPGCKMGPITRACDPGWGDAAQRLTQFAPGWVGDLVPRDQSKEAIEKLYFWFASLAHHYPEISPRIMLQHLGTEWGRAEVDQNIWVNALISASEKVLLGHTYSKEAGFTGEKCPPPVGIVVSDIRFFNELEMIKKANGKVIKVVRDAASVKAKTLGIANHASEAEQNKFSDDDFDAVLSNDGTIKELHTAIDIVATAHLVKNNE